jgi:predicted transposase YdaD
LSEPKNAAAELRALLPQELARRIDWSTLRHRDTTLVDEELRDRYADLVFEAKLGAGDAIIYVLVEHLSEPDEFVRSRLLRYMMRLWESALRAKSEDGRVSKGTKLPPIVPGLVLHSTLAQGAPSPPPLGERSRATGLAWPRW